MPGIDKKSADRLFEDVTAWLIQELETGNAPWEQPWSSRKIRIGGRAWPMINWSSNIRSPTSYYSIFNHFFLCHQMDARKADFRSNFWITPAALESLGIEPDEPPYFIVSLFQRRYGGSGYAERDLYHVEDVKGCEKALGFSFADQEKHVVVYKEARDALDVLKQFRGLQIHDGKGYAAFDPVTEVILMPGKDQFIANASNPEEGEGHYWATLWHEAIHWTGHYSRLDRTLSFGRNSRDYALEELVAETGSAFLCAWFGITARLQHAGYMAEWLSELKEERGSALRTAFEAGQTAARWIIQNSRRPRIKRNSGKMIGGQENEDFPDLFR